MRSWAATSMLLVLASLIVAGCTRCCPSPSSATGSTSALTPPRGPVAPLRAGAPAPAFDREVERRAVMRVVLVELYGGSQEKRFVLDRTLRAGGPWQEPLDDREVERLHKLGWSFEEPLKLSDGSRVFRPTMKGLDTRLVDDWAAHAASSPTPTDLDVPLPIDWMTEADWDSIEVRVGADRIDLDETWAAFHRKHPDSAGWIHLADVGFTPAGDAALTYAWSLSGSLAGGGQWILLSKRDGRWRIVRRAADWVS